MIITTFDAGIVTTEGTTYWAQEAFDDAEDAIAYGMEWAARRIRDAGRRATEVLVARSLVDADYGNTVSVDERYMVLPLTTDQTVWTVVGYYDGQGDHGSDAFADHAEADDATTAMAVVASRYEYPDLVIVGAVPGRHQLTTPGCDNGSTAYAVDLAELLSNDDDDEDPALDN